MCIFPIGPGVPLQPRLKHTSDLGDIIGDLDFLKLPIFEEDVPLDNCGASGIDLKVTHFWQIRLPQALHSRG